MATAETPSCDKESIATPATEIDIKVEVKLDADIASIDPAAGSKRGPSEGAEAVVKQNESKRPKQEENDSDGDDDKGSGKFQKRMMAIQFGYVGTGYAGLQKYVNDFSWFSRLALAV
jgi:hypothetical protein